MRFRLNRLLYLICGLTDFAAFVVIFTVSRSLAEQQAEPWYLGIVGAGWSFSAGVGSILGGWLAHRFDGRVIFVSGAATIVLSIVACWLMGAGNPWFVAGYWALGIGLGFLYPPLIGWLNQGEDAHVNRRGVSRTLIIFCVSWNLGMMGGQLTAGSLFAWGAGWAYSAALAGSVATLLLALAASRRVVPPAASPSDTAPATHEARQLATAFKRLSWIANLGGMFGGAMVLHLLADLAVTIGVPPEAHGRLLACWRAIVIATYLLMHHSHYWHYRISTALASQALAAVGLVTIARAESADTLMIGLALLGQLVGYNYFSGLFYSTAGSSNERRALSAGIHEATLAVGMAVGTITGGVLGTLVNHRVPYLMAGLVMLALIVAQSAAWWRWVRPLRSPPPETPRSPPASSS